MNQYFSRLNEKLQMINEIVSSWIAFEINNFIQLTLAVNYFWFKPLKPIDQKFKRSYYPGENYKSYTGFLSQNLDVSILNRKDILNEYYDIFDYL